MLSLVPLLCIPARAQVHGGRELLINEEAVWLLDLSKLCGAAELLTLTERLKCYKTRQEPLTSGAVINRIEARWEGGN